MVITTESLMDLESLIGEDFAIVSVVSSDFYLKPGVDF